MLESLRVATCGNFIALISLLLSIACSDGAASGAGEQPPPLNGGSTSSTQGADPRVLEASTLRVVEHAGKPLLVMSGAVTADTGGKLPMTNGSDFLLARLLQDGKVDTSFGQGGLAAIDFGALGMGGVHDQPMAVEVTADAKIVLAGRGGRTPLGIGAAPVLARFLPDGKPDPSFGQGGRVLFVPKGTDRGEDITFRALDLDEQGRLYVYGGEKYGPTWLLRFAADGTHDATFANKDAHIDPNIGTPLGLVVTSTRVIAISNDFGVAAYTHAGVVDESFGKKGYIDGGEGQATQAIRRADGAIVVAGVRYSDSSDAAPLKFMAFDENGALVPGFGMGGTALHDAGVSSVRGVAATPDGSLYVSYSGPLGALSLMKLTPQGSLDASFGEGGKKKLVHRVSLVDLSEVNSNDLGLVGDTVWMTIDEVSNTPSTIVTVPISR